MLVVAKKPRIRVNIEGVGEQKVYDILKKEYPTLRIEKENTREEDEYVDSESSEWFKEMKANWHVGDTLQVRRKNRLLTQKQLSEMTGISVPNISAMESGKRNIGAKTARILANALNCDVSDFIA